MSDQTGMIGMVNLWDFLKDRILKKALSFAGVDMLPLLRELMDRQFITVKEDLPIIQIKSMATVLSELLISIL